MNRKLALAVVSTLAFVPAAFADYNVKMNAIDIKGIGVSVGSVRVSADPKGGVVLTPDLKGLPPGDHGFHMHLKNNCSAMQKDGKLEPGEGAGPHFDPKKTHKHAGPTGGGHQGDLPLLKVAADGTATAQMNVPGLKVSDFRNRSLIIHADGDNYAEQPKSNGGGGARIACGMVQSGVK
jgi:Cu-Zn family superoxide dismutase